MTANRLYAVAFAAAIASAGLLAAAGIGSLRSVGLMQASIALSIVAAASGTAALIRGRRGRRA